MSSSNSGRLPSYTQNGCAEWDAHVRTRQKCTKMIHIYILIYWYIYIDILICIYIYWYIDIDIDVFPPRNPGWALNLLIFEALFQPCSAWGPKDLPRNLGEKALYDARWCPSSLAKLVQISPISRVGVLSIVNKDYKLTFTSRLGGTTLCELISWSFRWRTTQDS
jgi:hypothetical protein